MTQMGLFEAPRATGAIRRDALLSDCGRYRYTLARWWDDDAPRVVWCMLNPSTADATEDDRTVGRCKEFARSWGYGGITIVNLFAWRSTDPDVLPTVADPVPNRPPGNDGFLTAAATAAHANGGIVVAGWGSHGDRFPDRVREACDALTCEGRIPLHALAVTASGQPRHPLYLRGTLQPTPWTPPSGP